MNGRNMRRKVMVHIILFKSNVCFIKIRRKDSSNTYTNEFTTIFYETDVSCLGYSYASK